jgi:hypothetical protein
METDLPDGIESHQWFRTRREAVEAARAQHSYEAHPEVHLYGHGGGPKEQWTSYDPSNALTRLRAWSRWRRSRR